MLKKSRLISSAGLAALMLALAACGGAAASPTVAPAPTQAPAQPQPTVAPTEAPTQAPEPTVAPTEAPPEPTAAPTEAPAPAATGTIAPTEAPAAAEAAVFKINSEKSKAAFSIDEKLRGNPVTVLGITSKVSGDITISPNDLSLAKIGAIQIDARDLTTDSSFRNTAIRRFILESNKDEFQFITFEPTAIEGLPASAKVGDTLTFKIIGNLKVRTIVKPVTFETTATMVSDTEISGTAKTVVTRTDYELTIPTVPGVADVSDAVGLEITFVATK